MAFRLQTFKNSHKKGVSQWTYNFAVIDDNKAKDYPANFVCMLPLKIYKGKNSVNSVFGSVFGDKSLEYAVKLLNDAYTVENDTEVKGEIEKRLKLIDPKQANIVKCSYCKTEFQIHKKRKNKNYFCNKCLNTQQQHNNNSKS
jgi:hypothetical protein